MTSKETADERLGEEEPTRPGIAPASPLATALGNLGLSFNEIVRDISESARLIDELENDDRKFALIRLAQKLGDVADICFDARKAVHALAFER